MLTSKCPPLFLISFMNQTGRMLDLIRAYFDYPAAVGRVVFFHGCEPPFVSGFFKRRKPQKGELGVATPTRFPQDKMSDLRNFDIVNQY